MDGLTQPAPLVQLRFLEKIDLFLKLIAVGLCFLYALVIGIFRGSSGAKRYRAHVGHTVMRSLMARLTMRQIHYVTPPTKDSYELFAIQKKTSPETIQMRYGALGHWIGQKNARKVLIYYHGGGFQLGASTACFDFLARQIEKMHSKHEQLAVFVLNYALTPYATYPAQLRQAVEALRHIKSSYSPSNIILGGDSAGGNLVLGVLSHLSHPHPDIEDLIIQEPLAGAFMLSPWVSFTQSGQSTSRNQFKDLLTTKCFQRWSSAYLDDNPSDIWSEPILAPPDWWEGIKVRKTLIIAGSDEILLTSIEEFVKIYQQNVPITKFVTTENEGHVAAILDSLIGDTNETQQEKVLFEWLNSCCD